MAVTAAEPLKLLPVKPVPSVNALVVLAVIVMLAEPLKLTPLMLRAVVSVAAEPVVFWFSVGNVQLAKLPDAGVPSAGVTSVGLSDRTTEPVPVEDVTPVPPLATGRVPDT